MIEQVREAKTVDEMRVELERMRRYCPLVNATFQAALLIELSEDELHIFLAYYALTAYKALQAKMIDRAAREATPPSVTVQCNGGDFCKQIAKRKSRG